PTKPQMDGADLSSFKDPTGKAFFVEMADTVRQNGAGFVAYEWPRPGADKPVPKISYIKGFAPWGWVVGTGIYIDDVNAIWRQDAEQAATALLVLLAVLAVVGLGCLPAHVWSTEPHGGLHERCRARGRRPDAPPRSSSRPGSGRTGGMVQYFH